MHTMLVSAHGGTTQGNAADTWRTQQAARELSENPERFLIVTSFHGHTMPREEGGDV